MPESMRSTEAPALFVLTDGDEQALVNYRVRGGYYVVDVEDLDEATAWAAKCPAAPYASIEVRPVLDTSQFEQ